MAKNINGHEKKFHNTHKMSGTQRKSLAAIGAAGAVVGVAQLYKIHREIKAGA